MSITAFKSITMAESCLLSQPSLFSTKTKYKSISNSNSNSFKPRNLSFPHTLSLNCRKTPRHSSLLTFVAQTSDWAQPEVEQEDGATWENEEEPKWGNEDSEEVSEGGSFEEASEEEEEEELKIFVGNLPFDVDGEQLAGLFEQFGTVEVAEVIYNRVTDRSRGFGFVTMSTSEEVEKAVEKLSGYELNGRQLTVNKAAPRGAPRPERTPRSFESSALKVYVGNLPWDVDNGRLEQIFSEHVKVENAWVVYDRESGRSRGFGFVTVSNEADVNDAIAALDGQTLDGRALRVNVAEDRARRSF